MEAVQPLQSLLETLNARVSALESNTGCTNALSNVISKDNSVSYAEEITSYDAFTAKYMPPFLMAAEKLGPEPKQLAQIVENAYNEQREFLVMASQCKKPDQLTPDLLEGLQKCMKELNAQRDSYARTDYSNHSKMIGEGIQALGWVCEVSTPRPFVESYVGAMDFWGNKIRVEHKTNNPDQIEFVVTFKHLMVELMAYIKSYHVAGLTWNTNGKNVREYEKSLKANTTTASSTKKVPIVNKPESSGAHKSNAAKPTATIAKKPVFEQRNINWHVEHQSNTTLTIKDIHMKQQIYIFGCENTTITMEGKAKSIVLDSCKKTNVIFDNAISSLEIVSCQKVQVQCKGTVPSVAIDKTDGCQLYITWENRDVLLVTSKSTEMNVNLPSAAGSDDFIEKPIPEQYYHRIMEDLTISSQVSDLYS